MKLTQTLRPGLMGSDKSRLIKDAFILHLFAGICYGNDICNEYKNWNIQFPPRQLKRGVKAVGGLLSLLQPSKSDGNFQRRTNVDVLCVRFDTATERMQMNLEIVALPL